MKALFLCAIFAVAVAVIAQHSHPAPAGSKNLIACPVMPKNKVDIPKATKGKMYADYKGNRYFFCCDSCPKLFKKNPAKFAKLPHIKTPRTVRKAN